jgi:hypothetical protein
MAHNTFKLLFGLPDCPFVQYPDAPDLDVSETMVRYFDF